MSQNSFSLIVFLPGEAPVPYDLQGDTITFGRSPENNIQMLIAEVSVRHGQFVKEGEGYRIVDPGSTNGTKVNGAAVGPEGVALGPMDRLVFGTVVQAYFVPAAVLASTTPADLVASLESAAAVTPANPKTAPVSVAPANAPAAPIRSAVPVSVAPAPNPGGATVKLDQVRAPGTAVRPAPVPTSPRLPVAGAPAGGPPKAPPAAPGKPSVGMPPKAPGQPARPVAPPAAGVPGALQPVPLKRPAPSSPTIPLPKLPPKPGQ